MGKRYWTKEELIAYFKQLAYEFQKEGGRYHNDFYLGKAEAYETAAFELEHNFKETEDCDYDTKHPMTVATHY